MPPKPCFVFLICKQIKTISTIDNFNIFIRIIDAKKFKDDHYTIEVCISCC
jgi:hypothetical protein